MGVVTNPRTRSALAPTYAVVMLTAALSLRGYWRTFSVRIACTPAIRMTRFTTMAITGRRMKRSVSFMSWCSCLLIRRLGVELRPGRLGVVHRHRHAVAQLEGAGAHQRLAGRDAGHHGHEIAAPLAQAHELLPRDR